MRLKSTLRLIAFLLLLHSNLFAQNFWVPDSNFRVKLKQLYPTCFTPQDSMITICSQIQNEISLDLTFLQISSLDGIQYFTSLEHLFCYSNHLTSLPTLPASIIFINCSNNQLNSLPALPTSLLNLNCSEINNEFACFTSIFRLPVLLFESIDQFANFAFIINPLNLRE
ncbi:MAG: hypothetical protein IPO70_10235 [Bacteroidetes bacterium]|nr:hypothetical protein [Bacteroidota bacterium]